MNHQEKNFENPEEELGSSSAIFKISNTLKLSVSIVAVLILSACLFYIKKYIESPTTYASPSDLGLTMVFLFSIFSLFIVWIPWHKLGMRITKIGGIEFKEIVAEQASEHAEEISYLEDRIEVLEANYRRNSEVAEISEHFQEPELRGLLTDFLTKYHNWAFSPSRIRAWGSQQQGFSTLTNYEHPFIRSTLQKMVSEGVLETRISKKGNTLYRILLP